MTEEKMNTPDQASEHQLDTKCAYCNEIQFRFDLPRGGAIVSCKNPTCFKTRPTIKKEKAETEFLNFGEDILDLLNTARKLGFGLCIRLLEDAWKASLVDEGFDRENINRLMGKKVKD